MNKNMSNVVAWIIKDLSTMKYFYRSVVEGSYETALRIFPKPIESKKHIVDFVIKIYEKNWLVHKE